MKYRSHRRVGSGSSHGRSSYGSQYNRVRSDNKRQIKKLNSSLFVQKAVEDKPVEYTVQHSFSDYEISSRLHNTIRSVGYTVPTPIQDQCIPHILNGKDVLGIAHTGTGKTAAFLIPLINKLLIHTSDRVLIIAPTRELALQIEEELRKLTKDMNMFSLTCIGGTPLKRQIERLRRHPHFVIGTPGRLLDLETRQAISFSNYSSVVLDEVDRMLDMGFVKDITYILQQLPKERQSLFFSATLPQKVDALIRSFLPNHITVKIDSNEPSHNVDQDIIRFSHDNKFSLLEKLLSEEHVSKTIVFGRTKWGIKKLTQQLSERGFKVAEIHGNKTQAQRQNALDKFRNHTVNILLATDVAARGIDVKDITHVINYDAPESYDDYIHRIGRTGRAGKKGTALTFVEA